MLRLLACLVIVFASNGQAVESTKTTVTIPQTTILQTTIPPTTVAPTTLAPVIKTLDSNLCKTCHCLSANKTLNCSHLNKTTWFEKNDWDTLKYGDIQFDTIDLSYNQLKEIPKFEPISVKYLYLQNNQIENITKKAFEELSKLEEINLEHNSLTAKILTPDIFQGKYNPVTYEPLNVKKLNLAYNDIHSLDGDLFEHLPYIETLLINNNKLGVVNHITEIALSTVTLKVLDLSYTGLKTLPEYIFHSPRDLEEIRLSGNLFKEIPSALQYAENVKTLHMNDLDLLDNLEGKNIFPNLKKLETLYLSYCPKLMKIGIGGLSNLENLKKLYLTNNPSLTYIHPNAFARQRKNVILFDFPPLEEMYLHNNNLSVLDSALLERWDKIKIIDLRKNQWSCNCENHFLINVLFTQIIETTPNLTTEITCNEPQAWHGKEIKEIHDKETNLRCADLYNNHPESDGPILVGLVIGVLIGIPIAFAVLIVYKRGCFGLMKNDPGRYSRAFYSRTSADDYQI